MNNQEYWNEVENIADSIACEAMQECEQDKDGALDMINDYMLHEAIDGHKWVIYNAYHLKVLEHSNNEDYMIDNFGAEELSHALEQGGLSRLHQALAFWAFYADVQDNLDEALDEYVKDEE